MGPQLWERYSQDRKRIILAAPHRPHPENWSDTGLHAAWLGHSSVLLKIDGITVLTDPVLGSRAGLTVGPVTVGLKRLVAPALTVEETPQPDLILLSHTHMDHFDITTLRGLESPETQVITAARTSDLLRTPKYQEVTELAWGQQTRFKDLTIRAFEVNHWGARMRTDTWRGFNGYVIDSPRYRILFGGDTAMTNTFRKMRTSRPVDLAIMPIGAYNPWIHAHCTPEQALKMANDAGSDFVLPVHHKTFNLSSEPYLEPIERMVNAVAQDARRLALSEIGEEFHFSK